MTPVKFVHEILADLIEDMLFVVDFDSATDNNDGTFTLNGICTFHHLQPGADITIDGHTYTIKDYDYDTHTLLIEGTDSISVKTFMLLTPFFCHGTPIQQEDELTKIPLDKKTPMIYLMEPYSTENDYSPSSAIDRRCDITLCFLTQADVPKWLTDDFYHNAIHPMNNLMEDFVAAMIESNLFFTVKQKASPKFYTKFGINIQQLGTKELYFSENLSGVGLDLRLEIYADDDCSCSDNLLITDRNQYIEVD